jgi:nucleoside-diphosphate-sugar epimerase
MKVAISGSRGFLNRWLVMAVIDRLIERGDTILVGDAPRGVDRMVAEYVSFREDDVADWKEYPADWDKYGRRAGHERNEWMVHDADALIAIFAPGPLTPGTQNALWQARKRGIPTAVYHDGEWEGSL